MKIGYTIRHALSIMTVFWHIDIAVMNNSTHFIWMGRLNALMVFWDHQLSIEYKIDIV